jgi:hypothetical protein
MRVPAARAGRLGCLLAGALLGGASAAAAQLPVPRTHGESSAPARARGERRMLLLRTEETPPRGAAASVERSLRQALRELGFVVVVSPMPFRDAQLAAGCPGTIRQCGSSVAAAVDGGQLAVSSLETSGGELSLHLYSFAASGEVREATRELPSASSVQLDGAVRALAAEVYAAVGAREERPATAAAPERRGRPRDAAAPSAAAAARASAASAEPPPGQQRDPVLWAVGWSATGLGSALLIGGMASHLAAGSSGEGATWSEDRRPGSESLATYERDERRADAARVLYGAGGALLLTGVTLLVVGRLSAQRDGGLHASVLPLRQGAALSFVGSFGGNSP